MIFLGAMSGTSTDGIDVAALQIEEGRFSFLGHLAHPFSSTLRTQLLALQQVPCSPQLTQLWPELTGQDWMSCLLLARRDLSLAYAQAIEHSLQVWSLDPLQVRAVGAHGQTLRHRPDLGFTFQLLDPALLAAESRCAVVSDFRSRDVADGGQGAPLVPAFHRAWLAQCGLTGSSAVLNLGGFSNLTCIHDSGVVGGDCGPANAWMDQWVLTHFGLPYDEQGRLAASAPFDAKLLSVLKTHPFFWQSWPKSTGRDDFSWDWLQDAIRQANAMPRCSPEQVLSTLLQLGVDAVLDCLNNQAVSQVILCGGGAQNTEWVRRFTQGLPSHVSVRSFADLGLPEMAVEAAAFAWLAWAHLHQQPGAELSVTGARRSSILGSFTPY